MNTRSLFRTASFLVLITIISRALGLVREAIIAGYFGVGPDTDAFFVAFRVPDLLFNSLINFLVATSFIPIFSKYLVTNDKNETWAFSSNVINVMLMFLFVFTVLVEIFATQIVSFLAPGLEKESLSLAVRLTRIMIPIVIFGGLTGLFKSVLNTLQHFTVPAFITIVYNVFIISAVLVLARRYGIVALAIGVVLAALFQFLIQMPVLISKGMRYCLRLDLRDEGLIGMGRLLHPVVLALMLGQIVPYFEIYLASQMSAGAISYLNYAGRIVSAPDQIYTVVVSSLIFTSLSADVASGDRINVVRKLSGGIRITIFVILPLSFILIGVSSSIIKLLLGRGAFEASAVEGTSKAFVAYSVGLSIVCVRNLVSYTFFALKDPETLLKVTALMVPINICLDLILVRFFSYTGLALGASLTALLHMSALFMYLRRHAIAIEGRRIMNSFSKILISSGVMMALILLLKENLHLFPSSSAFIQLTSFLFAVSVLSSLVYLTVVYVLKVEEAQLLWHKVFKQSGGGLNKRME